MTPNQKLQRVRFQLERKTIAYEKKYAKLIRKALIEQVEQAINNMGIIDDKPMFDALKPLYETVAFDFLQWQYNLLDKRLKTKAIGFFLNSWRDWIQSYIFTALAKKVVDINETTRKKIQEAIAIGVDQGLEWEHIARLIREKVGNAASLSRSIMIAATETANAANMAKEKSKEDWYNETQEPIYKLWIHRYAREPRSWHLALDNNIAIPDNQDFVVRDPKTNDIELMKRPHAENASAKNVVRCSCQALYVSKTFAKSLAN